MAPIFYIFLLHIYNEIVAMKNKSIAFASVFIIIGAIFRLMPHPPNATPLAAMAFVGGIYISRKYMAFLLPILVLLISDIILNNTINRAFFTDQSGFILFNSYMIWTYLAFALTVLIGLYLHKNGAAQKIIFGTLLSSVAFYIITNFGTWLSSGLYPKDLTGLLTAFGAAVPFFRNTLISNAIFISVFVLAIEGLLAFSYKKELAQ
jgi:hypothetical protein